MNVSRPGEEKEKNNKFENPAPLKKRMTTLHNVMNADNSR